MFLNFPNLLAVLSILHLNFDVWREHFTVSMTSEPIRDKQSTKTLDFQLTISYVGSKFREEFEASRLSRTLR